MTGPTLQNNLLSILLRFRQHKYVVAGDIEKMYRQVDLNPNQRALQRILWRDNVNENLNTFELNTITYGTTAASFLAIRCLFQLAFENKSKFPEYCEIIENDFYVDDMLTGSNSIKGAAAIAKGVHDILNQGVFKLRKFYSNDARVLDWLDSDDNQENKIIKFGKDENAKTLGLMWMPYNDYLFYRVGKDNNSNSKITKRTILSEISQIFDPLGLLGPCIIIIKILLQQLWLEKLSWDEGLPMHIHNTWCKFKSELQSLNDLKIKRFALLSNCKTIELHAFSDASEKAYGASIYLRVIDESGNISVALLCAKSKVAPLKVITLPKLELSGTLIAARLAEIVIKSLRASISNRVFWTDSTIVLGWLKLAPNTLKTFVSNRVSEIQCLTGSDDWRHVPTKDNPSDILSRGIMPEKIKDLNLWWQGPDWLSLPERHWPNLNKSKQSDLPEIKQSIKSFPLQIFKDVIQFERFSNLNRLKRAMAWVIRFKNNCILSDKDNKTEGNLTVEEVNEAMKILIKVAQRESFLDEIQNLNSSKSVGNKSKILNLNPFIDQYGLLRVGGRLSKLDCPENKRHPIILHSKHRLTKLIFENEHIRLLHAGPRQLLASIRENFWPVSGRNLAKRTFRQCVACFRVGPKPIQSIMGQLPESRLHVGSVFDSVGVDYAGPLLIKDRKGRGGRISKCYLALFVCLSTKALHLEIVSDLTCKCFLMALKRFISRRGIPSNIYSDNGKNFVAAHRELSELSKFLTENDKNIIEYCSQSNISWHFIPPYSPHFGGIWEVGVKSRKFHLKRIIGNAHLTFEELNTLIVHIEAILNSRPLLPLSDHPDDLIPLTPAHFLIGRPLTALPELDLTNMALNRLDRYQHVQQCRQHFWQRWYKEYLAELQRNTKWKVATDVLKEGTMVVIKEDNVPPLTWKIGRITNFYPGPDGVIRVVSIKTANGEIKRNITKLCPLPYEDGADAKKDK